MSRLLTSHRQRGGHRASRPVARTCRAPTAAGGAISRRPAMQRSLRRGDSALLRQNAAVMFLEAQLKAVWNRSLAAIGYVNLYFHLDFREFNI